MDRECMLCHTWIDGVVHGCFIPVLKTDKKLEVTGCEQCIKKIAKKFNEKGKSMSLDETKIFIGLVDD